MFHLKKLALVTVMIFLLFGCSPDQHQPFQKRDHTGVDFSNTLLESDSFNIIQYLYYYNGGGVAAGDLNNDGLPDLFFTGNETSNRLYLNRGDFHFEDITAQAGVGTSTEWSTGVTMVDINNDGWLDIYVCQLGDYKGKKGRNRLYVNQGKAGPEQVSFREQAADYGLDFQGFATQAAFFDYDRDGDLDVYLLNHSVHSVGNYGKAASLRPQRDSLAGDLLLRNDGGQYTDVTAAANIMGSRIGYGLGMAIGDLNEDGWPDLYISNDFHENDYLYYNNGDGTFREDIEGSLSCSSQFSMGNSIADWNNDSRPDIISLDMKPEEEVLVKNTVGADPYNIYLLKRGFGYYHQFPRNMLQLNRGSADGQFPVFSEVAQLAGVEATDWSWSPLVVDLDNDGWKDIFITNGIWRRPNDLDYLKYVSNREIMKVAADQDLAAKMPSGKAHNYAFRNRGDLTFENVGAAWGLDLFGVSNGAAYADLDNDGDYDLIVSNLNAPAAIYENQNPTGNHYLKVALDGEAGNVFGLGAKVTVTIGEMTQIRELYPTSGYLSAVEPVLLFGTGQAQIIDRVEVQWPTGGRSVETKVAADQTIRISQPAGDIQVSLPALAGAGTLPNYGLNFRHRENSYIDLEFEPLMPNLLSTQGPRMAVADVNGDGQEDVYFCGAKGQTGALYYQMPNGSFAPAPEYFTGNIQGEEVDAVFFDADQDGDLDLFVVNGSGELEADYQSPSGRLYLNDGQGRFSYAEQAMPAAPCNGSCAVVLDFNGDGALDLFVGARSIPGSYGLDPTSLLWMNTGNGRFQEVGKQHLPAAGKLGMVTDAGLMRRGDEQLLVVVGEWMPVSLLQVGKGSWQMEQLPNSEGWWNRLNLADCNGDGTDDIILGNWGLNSLLKASPEQPLSLYVKDFDGNRNSDPVMTYYRQGKEYPLASIDELTGQMPTFRKLLDTYANFSTLSFPEVFKPSVLEGALHKQAVCLSSSIALSDGQGSYQLQPLPQLAQLSPVFGIVADDFDQDGAIDLYLAGNFYGSRPELGLSDASTGSLILGDGRGGFREAKLPEMDWQLRGEVRDMKILRTPARKLLVIARNNQATLVEALEQGIEQ